MSLKADLPSSWLDHGLEYHTNIYTSQKLLLLTAVLIETFQHIGR